MANQIRFKQNTAAAAAASNPVLAAGEPGFEVDSGKFGIGNGVTPWNELPKIGNDKFLGTYLTLAALTAAHPAPAEGSEAHINEVGAVQVQKAIWDSEDSEWVIVGGVSTGVQSTATGEPTGSDTINNIVTLTQAEYDAGPINPTTLYIITDQAEDEFITFACSDETTDLVVGTSVFTFRMPYAMTLTAVRANVNTAPTDANINVDINENGTSIFSTVLSIDATEKTSTTAAAPAVISNASLSDDSEITIDIDQVGVTEPGKGLKVTLIGKKG